MKTLDRSRPFGTVYGQHKARYTQDGADFDGKGRMLGGRTNIPQPPAASTGVVQEEVPLDNLTIKELKAAVQAAGGEYTNRLDAVKFLKEVESDDLS